MELRKSIKQFALYVVVGGLATLVEWAVFFLSNQKTGMHYMLATAVAFVFSTLANWAFGKLILFHEKQNLLEELLKIYLVSIAGLLLNLIIMWVLVDQLAMNAMLSKIIATGIVFFWNFLIRKLVIYKV